MSVSAEVGPREGSPADLAKVISSEDAYKRRLEDLQARHAALDAKIALAGKAEDVVRLQREAAALQARAQVDAEAATKVRGEADAQLASARVVARDTIEQATQDAQARAQQITDAANATATETRGKADEHASRVKSAADALTEKARAADTAATHRHHQLDARDATLREGEAKLKAGTDTHEANVQLMEDALRKLKDPRS